MGGSTLSKPTGPVVVELPAERAGESPIYRNATAKDGLLEYLDQDIQTTYDAFERTVKRFPHNKYLGWRVGESPYKWMSYKMAHTRATNIAAGLRHLGLEARKELVGLYSINRPEWMLVSHAADHQAMTLVPLYDTLGPEVVQFIVNQAEIQLVFCSGDKMLENAKTMKTFKILVSFDEIPAEMTTLAKDADINLLSIDDVEALGKNKPVDPNPPKPDDMQTICYTSGTTGDPKGVITTHRMLLSNMAGVTTVLAVQNDDIHISYLPLAHIFERLIMNTISYHGAAAGFYRGDVRKLFDDIEELKPTIFASVPRLWNRLYDKVMAAVRAGSSIKQKLFETAYETKAENLKEGYLTHSVWDSLVFGKIRDKLGGRVRFMMSGSAPLSETVHTFLRVCFAVPVLEGYGQTENAAALTTQLPWDQSVGHVGIPIPSVELKLVDVPHLNYLTTDERPRGEVCFRGPVASPGYYKNKDKTDELIDANGWRHTGDVGMILPGGFLKIIDRFEQLFVSIRPDPSSKNIFKLSQGEYIAPEKLENIFVQTQWIAQVFVYGDSLKSSLVGIIVPDFEVLTPWAKAKGHKDAEDPAALCKDPEIVKMIIEDANKKGKENKLRGFEVLAAIHLSHEAFTVENDLVTPSFKLKRPQAKARYQAEIDEMYKDLQ